MPCGAVLLSRRTYERSQAEDPRLGRRRPVRRRAAGRGRDRNRGCPMPRRLRQRDARLAWWREARFGLFIHWGPASVSGKEISWARIGHPHDHPGHESVPPEEYDNLYKRFNPVKFDADAWMRLAKDAGMKYVVFITKHHDGFSMWPTKLRPEYSIAATPFPTRHLQGNRRRRPQARAEARLVLLHPRLDAPRLPRRRQSQVRRVLHGPGPRTALQLRPRGHAVVRPRGRQLARLPVPGTVRA